MSKTASGLVAYCKAQLGLPYWWGTFGNIATEALYQAKKKQYPKYYTASDFRSQFGKRVHDCVGMIKGFRWSATPTSPPVYVASQDVSVSGLYDYQCSQKGYLKTMPDQAGVCVFMNGHVGVYVGGGWVIEARGHAYGVVKTQLNARPWTRWGKPSWITYDTPVNGRNYEVGTVNVKLQQLSKGAKGAAVKKLQIMLNALGYPCGEADGEFGEKTDSAVRAYQKAMGLTCDGIAGAATLAKLYG